MVINSFFDEMKNLTKLAEEFKKIKIKNYFAFENLFSTSSQFTTFHHAPM
jgi:hypothetical protein